MKLKRIKHPLFQLVLSRLLEGGRDPGTLFGLLVVPMLLAAVVGFAMRSKGTDRLPVDVVDGPGAAELVAVLATSDALQPVARPLDEARRHLRSGEAAVFVIPGDPPELRFDPEVERGQLARARVLEALARAKHGAAWADATEARVSEPGSRYIDFFLPGILSLTLMMACLSLGQSIVWFRMNGLLKQLVSTPMKKTHFMLSHIISRGGIGLIIAVYYALGGYLLFGVKFAGSVIPLALFGALGAFTFASIGFLVGSRARNQELVNGLAQIVTMIMIAVSGVFFSVSTFPSWMRAAIGVIPLAAMNDGLRAYYQEGTLASLARPALILGVEGLTCFALALKLFRWV